MWEEIIFVAEGSGYDLHWDLKWDCLEAFQWEWAAEPKAYSWKRGDYIYIPPFTNHQHVAGDHEECRLIVMSNRITKEMGFDWFDQVANAPGFDAAMKNGGGVAFSCSAPHPACDSQLQYRAAALTYPGPQAARSPLRLRQPQHRLDHRRRIGDALAGDVVAGAVRHRGKQDRRADGQRRGGVLRQQLRGDVALVVQHDDEGVEARHVKHGVGAERARDVMPSAATVSIAGLMISISSRPNSPPSPACGLSPLTAIFGAAMPMRLSVASVARIVRATFSRVISAIASRTLRCSVQCAIRVSPKHSIM